MSGTKTTRPCKKIKVISNVSNLVRKAKLHCLGEKHDGKVSYGWSGRNQEKNLRIYDFKSVINKSSSELETRCVTLKYQ